MFRHIMNFLRDGMLPQKMPVLQQLYAEAAFFRLGSLRDAIEITLGRRPSKLMPPAPAKPETVPRYLPHII